MESPKPYREERPWGEELWISDKKPSQVKILSINPREQLSLQHHRIRDEFWHVISGDGIAEIGDRKMEMKAGLDFFVSRGTNHRIFGGEEKLVILELAFGDFDENDIVRIEDKYGRVKGPHSS